MLGAHADVSRHLAHHVTVLSAMSVQVLSPSAVSTPPLSVINGINGVSLNGPDDDSVMENGAEDASAGQKFIPNMIYPPPDMRSKFVV